MCDRLLWKRRIGRLHSFMRARDAQRKLILLYHSVGGGAEATAIDAFRDQIGIIAAMGDLLPLQQVLEFAPGPRIAVAITFDDGGKSGLAAAAINPGSPACDPSARPAPNTRSGLVDWMDASVGRPFLA